MNKAEILENIRSNIDKIEANDKIIEPLQEENDRLKKEISRWDKAEYWQQEFNEIRDFLLSNFEGLQGSKVTYEFGISICAYMGCEELWLKSNKSIIDMEGNTFDYTKKFDMIYYDILSGIIELYTNESFHIQFDDFARQLAEPKSAITE